MSDAIDPIKTFGSDELADATTLLVQALNKLDEQTAQIEDLRARLETQERKAIEESCSEPSDITKRRLNLLMALLGDREEGMLRRDIKNLMGLNKDDMNYLLRVATKSGLIERFRYKRRKNMTIIKCKL